MPPTESCYPSLAKVLESPQRAKMGKRSNTSDAVFLNVPYDQQFQPLYLAFIAGLSGFGLVPHAVLEIPTSERRLDRILSLIRTCGISFHDLSRVELDPARPRTPRFNMPFELGLVVALQRGWHRSHQWYVFEAKAHRAEKSLSDLKGTEVHIHRARPRGVLQELTNILIRISHQPTVAQLEGILRDLNAVARKIAKEGRSKSLFETRAFVDLVAAAKVIAPKHVASLSEHH